MTTQEIANRLVALCREGKNAQAYEELFSEDAVAIEPAGINPERTEGIDNLKAKTREWFDSIEERHGGSISDPLVSENYFTCTMNADVTVKGAGRMMMDEVCLYEVKDGKIVKERFFYNTGQ